MKGTVKDIPSLVSVKRNEHQAINLAFTVTKKRNMAFNCVCIESNVFDTSIVHVPFSKTQRICNIVPSRQNS